MVKLNIKEDLLIVLGTSSSEPVLPRMMENMENMENLGARKTTVGLVIPTGYSFNLDGTSIYPTMAAVLVAQATNMSMTLMQEARVPVAGLTLILGIDRFMSEARALTNQIGNGVATLVVAKWTNELDMERLRAGLNSKTWEEAQEPETVLDQKTEHMSVAS